MICLYCKTDTSRSTSREHIIPESLGNVDYVLPPGWVCDKCNNYFSREIEKPFLASPYCQEARFFMTVPSKKGRVPPISGMHLETFTPIEMVYGHRDRGLSVGAAQGEDPSRWIKWCMDSRPGNLIIPHAPMPEADYVTARFIGKVSIEVLAHAGLKHECNSSKDSAEWNEELAHKTELDELRNYVRRGNHRLKWPISIRRIYEPENLFGEDVEDPHQILHEFMILPTEEGEYYAVITIFGVEYALNLGGPEVDGYDNWLKANDMQSPLYLGSKL